MFGGSEAASVFRRPGERRAARDARSDPPRPPRGDVDVDARPARNGEPRAAAAAVDARVPGTTEAARRAGPRGVPRIARGATAERMFLPRAPQTRLRARAFLGEGHARDAVKLLVCLGIFNSFQDAQTAGEDVCRQFRRRLAQPRISAHSAPRRGDAMASSRAAGAPASTSGRFFGCYLVGSHNPAMRGRTYVGFTVDPPRRIRQHNGVLASGAKYTRRLRPCSMLLVVHGFPSKVQALQFEWAWQKPRLSRAVRETAAALGVSDKSSSVVNKTKLVMAMCSLSPWKHLPLTVHFFDDDAHRVAREQCALSPLPEQMEITKGDMEALTRRAGPFGGRDDDDEDDVADETSDAEVSEVSRSVSVSVSEVAADGKTRGDDATSRRAFRCGVCGKGHARVVPESAGQSARRSGRVGCPGCEFRAHPSCMAAVFFRQASEEAAAAGAAPPPDRALIPPRGRCPACHQSVSWGSALAAGRRKAVSVGSRGNSGFPETEDADVAREDVATAAPAAAARAGSRRSATVLGAGFYDDLEDESDDDVCGDERNERNKENADVFSDSDAPLRDRLAKRAAGDRRSLSLRSGGEVNGTRSTGAGPSARGEATPARAHVSISP